ncbi:hypothetical protein [Flavobacterium koreense]
MKNIFVKLKNDTVEINHIREMIEELEKEKIIYKNWFARPGLKEKNTDFVSRLYIGQSYDKNQFDLVENGWINDHCEICFMIIGEEESKYVETSGYFDGSDWVCKSCFEELVMTEDLEKKLSELEKFEE